MLKYDSMKLVKLGRICLNAANTSHLADLSLTTIIASGRDAYIKDCEDQTRSWRRHTELRHYLILKCTAIYLRCNATMGSFVTKKVFKYIHIT